MDLLTVREAARLLGVHPNTVRNWAKAGTLRPVRPAGSTMMRFERRDVESRLTAVDPAVDRMLAFPPPADPLALRALDLDRWADTVEARDRFPELMRRLLASTPGVTQVRVSAREGVGDPGWDGEALSPGTAFLPSGQLHFEFSVDKRPRSKAQADYAKRSEHLPDPGGAFVFATPRRWPGAAGWIRERSGETSFASVHAIDADVLVGWIAETPSAELWLSDILGRPYGWAQSIDRWWQRFQRNLRVTLPEDVFLSGRQTHAARLRKAMERPGDGAHVWYASDADDALAFVYAALGDAGMRTKTVVAFQSSGWERLAMSTSQMILIPLFDDPDVGLALDHAHKVLLLKAKSTPDGGNEEYTIPPLARVGVQRCLIDAGKSRSESQRLAALATRSSRGFIRSLSLNARGGSPQWDAHDASLVAPLCLLGGWTTGPDDLRMAEAITGARWSDLEQALQRLATHPDPPFTPTRPDTWDVTDRDLVLGVLLQRVTDGALRTWRAETVGAQGRPDGAGASTHLLDAVAATITHVMVHQDGSRACQHARHIVEQIFTDASGDATGRAWAGITQMLPHLAEAAPDFFLESLAAGAVETSSPVANAWLASSEFRVHLVWALETLSLSAEHATAASDALVLLAELAGERPPDADPLRSLTSALNGYVEQSPLSVPEKIDGIRRILTRNPSVGWRVAMSLWPRHSGVGVSLHPPGVRDWGREFRPADPATGAEFTHMLTQLVAERVGAIPARWVDVVGRLPQLGEPHRHDLIARLSGVLETQEWSADQRFSVWNALRPLVGAEGSPTQFNPQDSQRISAMVEHLEATLDARRHTPLFTWEHMYPDDEASRTAHDAARRQAVVDMLDRDATTIPDLVRTVAMPWTLGDLLGELAGPDFDTTAVEWLLSDRVELRQAAAGVIGARVRRDGPEWLAHILEHPTAGDAPTRDRLAAALPEDSEIWPRVEAVGGTFAYSYWSSLNPYAVKPADRAAASDVLVAHRLFPNAVTLLSLRIADGDCPSPAVVESALSGLAAERFSADRGLLGPQIGSLLRYLDTTGRCPDLSDLELALLDPLDDAFPLGATHRRLADDPKAFGRLIEVAYPRARPGPKQASAAARAVSAYRALKRWRTPPGCTQGAPPDAAALTAWVKAARLDLSERGLAEVGDEEIGQLLGSIPAGDDGIWPPPVVRDLVEALGSTHLETGLVLAALNAEGVTWRGAYEGGTQERERAAQYERGAQQVSREWPRTARMLRRIVSSYRELAAHFDGGARYRAGRGS